MELPNFEELSTDELVQWIDNFHGVENFAHVMKLHGVAELDRREAYKEDGARSAADWLAYRYGMSPELSRSEVRVARWLQNVPQTAETIADGLISWDKVTEMSTFVEADEDSFWANEAVGRAHCHIRAWGQVVRRRTREEVERTAFDRKLNMTWNTDQSVLRLSGQLPGAEGAVVLAAIDLLAELHGPNEDNLWEPIANRRADALVELAGIRIAPEADIDRATICVTIPASDLERLDGSGEIQYGPVIDSEVVRRMACDGRLQAVITGPDGQAVGIGRRSRNVPKSMTRELRRRDKGCIVCGMTFGVQSHHEIHWTKGGNTDLDNLFSLCWRCHRLVHEGGHRLVWALDRTPQLMRPNGTIVHRRPEKLQQKIKDRICGPPPLPVG